MSRGRGGRPSGGRGGDGRGGRGDGARGDGNRRGSPGRGGSGRRGSARGDARSAEGRRGPPRGGDGRGPDGRGPEGRRGRPPAPKRGLGGDQVEGRQAVREVLVAGRRRVREVLLSSELDASPILEDIIDLADSRRVTIREIGRGRFDTEALTRSHQGVLARVEPIAETPLEEMVEAPASLPFLLVLDGVTDPGNLGALLRSAECFGVTGVVLPRHRSAHITATVAKAAAGAVEYLRFAMVPGIPAALTSLRDRGVWVVGLDADGDVGIDGLRVADEPLALVLGSEGGGLAKLTRSRCDAMASIPMAGELNSLNVAAAGAIACAAIARGRHAG